MRIYHKSEKNQTLKSVTDMFYPQLKSYLKATEGLGFLVGLSRKTIWLPNEFVYLQQFFQFKVKFGFKNTHMHTPTNISPISK